MTRRTEKLTVRLPPGLKEKMKEETKYSNVTMTQLVEEKFREFLSENTNREIKHSNMKEYLCPNCGALYPESAYEKLDKECKTCNTEKDEFNEFG